MRGVFRAVKLCPDIALLYDRFLVRFNNTLEGEQVTPTKQEILQALRRMSEDASDMAANAVRVVQNQIAETEKRVEKSTSDLEAVRVVEKDLKELYPGVDPHSAAMKALEVTPREFLRNLQQHAKRFLNRSSPEWARIEPPGTLSTTTRRWRKESRA